MKKKFFRNIAHYLPQCFLLISVLTSNVLFPVMVLAQEIEDTNSIPQEKTAPIDTSEDILEEGISTSIYEEEEAIEQPFVFENGIYTVNKVIQDEEYVYPENENVRVKFTEVTQEGNLVIKRVELTEEQKELLNTKDSYGWDITSSMENGTFKYNLTLPNTQGNDDIEVKYTEDGNTYENIDNSNVEIKSNVVTIEGLDHFTTFVVVIDDGENGYSDNGWSSHNSGYKGDHKYVTSSQTDKIATWTYTGTDISNGAVFLSWTIWDDHATNATYKSSLFSDVTVNQKLNAAQTATDTNGTWSGWYRVPSTGSLSIPKNSTVTLSPISGTDGNLSADAVAFVDLNAVPNEVWVNDNYSNNNSGEHFWGYNAFNKIQDGVNAVASGGTVNISSGTYTENITINKRLEIEGSGSGDTINDTIITSSLASTPVVTITTSGTSDSERLVLSNIRVEGTGDNSEGIRISGSGSYITFSNVASVNNKSHGVNVPGSSNNVGYGLKITDCVFSNNGSVGFRTGSAAKISELTITNTHADHNYSAGLYFTGPLTGLNISGGTFDDNHGDSNGSNGIGIYTDYSGGGGINRGFVASECKPNSIKNTSVSGNSRGIILNILGGSSYLFENIIASNNNALSSDSGQGITIGSRDNIIQEIKFSNIIAENNPKSNLWFITYALSSVSNLSIQNSKLTNSSGYGLYLYAIGGSTLSKVSVTGSTITGNNTGIYLRAGSSTATLSNLSIEENSIGNNGTGILISNNISSGNSAHNNNIVGNTTAGIQNNDTDTVFDATLNWWGHITGPSIVGNGLGDKVSTNVTYKEWFCTPYQENVTSVPSVSGVCTLTAPEQTGYNVKNSPTDPENTPRPKNEIACTGGYTNINSVSVHWTDVSGGDSNIKYQRQYKINNGGWTGNEIYTNPYTDYRSFGGGTSNDGIYGSRVRAFYDTNRNDQYNVEEPVSGWSNECSITYDKTVPTISNVNVDKTFVKAGDIITITADVTDNSGVLAVSADFSYNGNYTSRPTPSSVTMTKTSGNTYQVQYTIPSSWAEGIMYIKVAARDLTGGNWVRSTGFDTVTVDNIAPTKPEMLGFNNPSLSCDAVTNSKYVTVDWSNSSDTGSGVKGYNYQINYPTTTGGRGLYNAFFTESQYRGSLNEGLHQIKVQAVDNAGNVSEWTDLCNITLDTVAPDVQITAPTSSHLTGTVEIKGTVTDANPHHYWFEITNSRGTKVAGLGTVNETNSFTDKTLLNWDTSSLLEGQYTIKLEARDSANNKDNGSKHWLVVNVDHTNPTVDLQFNVGANNFKAVFSENVNKEDAENPANYFLNNWPGADGNGDLFGDATINYDPSTYTATVTFTNSSWYISPEQQWGVQNIRDLAGNILASPYKEYSTPMVAPKTTISVIDSDWHSTDVTVNLVCTDIDGSGCSNTYYSLDGGTTYQEGNTIIVSAEGENKITYYSKDKAGNEEIAQTSDPIKIDKTEPMVNSINISGGLLSVASTDTLSGVKSVEIKINDGVWTPYATGMNLNTILNNTPGTYTIYVKVTDRAGNTTEGSTTYTIPEPEKTQAPAITEGAVLGIATTTTTPTIKRIINTTSPIYTTLSTQSLPTQTEETLETTSTEKEETSVLGEKCENNKKVSGYVYIDKNKDNQMNENEKGIKDITLTIQYTDEEGNIKTAEEVKTDEKGYWETQLCSGNYNIVVKKDTLPKNIEVSEVLSLTVSDNEEETIFNIQALDTRNFWQKYWYLIAIGLAVIAIGYVSIKNSKKEEI